MTASKFRVVSKKKCGKIVKKAIAGGMCDNLWHDVARDIGREIGVDIDEREGAVNRAAKLVSGMYKNCKPIDWSEDLDDDDVEHIVTLIQLAFAARD